MVRTIIEDDNYEVTIQADNSGGILRILNKDHVEDWNTIRYTIDKNGEASMKFQFDLTRPELLKYVILLYDYVHCDGQFMPDDSDDSPSWCKNYGTCDCE